MTPNAREAAQRVRDLPTLPAVLAKALETAADPDASALDLGAYIAADPSLSAALLRLVNSAYYGFYRRISSVSQAIVMLGFIEVRKLILTASAFRTMDVNGSDYDRVQLWRHSLATAMAAEHLGKVLRLEVDGLFEAGLLHDIGKVAFDLLYPEDFREAAHTAHEEELYIREVEAAIFGLDHAEMGALLADHWNLPEKVVAAIRGHHAPGLPGSYAAVVGCADGLTYAAGFGEKSNGRAPSLDAACAHVDLTEEQRALVLSQLEEDRERVDEFVGLLESL